MLGVKLSLGPAVYAVGCRRENLDEESRRPFDGPLCNNAAAIVTDEDEIRLDDGCGSKNHIGRRRVNIAKLVGHNMVGENPVKVARNALMFCTGRRRHGKFSIEDLVTVTVVRQFAVVVVGQNDLALRNALSGSRRHIVSFHSVFELFIKQVVATPSCCQARATDFESKGRK